jgi:putative membrane protein
MNNSSKLLGWLLFVYGALFTICAVSPIDRHTWFVENLTVWIIVGVILVLYSRGVRFSKLAYALMFLLIYLHTIGGHYTFALVPFDWFTNFFHFTRNHFDRIAHFSVGFYAFAVAEWIWTRKLVHSKFLLFTYPLLRL